MKSVKTFLVVALFVAIIPVGGVRAEEASSPTATTSGKERFLVIVEASAAMQKRAENTQKALGSVISGGLKGQIEPGCTIGLWTFNEKLFTGQVPLQLWTPQTRQRVALALVQVLQQQKNEKTGRLSVAWNAATNIVAHSERITLLLFTSGSEPVTGTPYDAQFAETFAKNADQQRKSNMPFVTILRAAKGKFVAYAVNMPPWPLEVPEWPAEYKPVAPPPEPEVAPPVAVTPPRPAPRPDPGILSPTNTIYLVETSAPVAVPVVAPPPQPEPTNPVVMTPAQPATNAAIAPVTAVLAESKPKPAVEAKPEAKPAATEPVPLAQHRQPMVTILSVGICVLLGVLLVFIALLRRSRRSAGESLITRSMNQRDR